MPIEYLVGRPLPETESKYSQVFRATHELKDGEWQHSPFFRRSFISFTFGGKRIEDFGLIAITKEDRINKNIYADFKNLTSQYEILDGQFYWGHTMDANKITFILATDGITEEQLNDFRYWFKPGEIKELVLAESPNRAIMARVESAPQYSFLPFEKKTKFNLDNKTYEIKVTEYKGEISISFVMDEPYWYAKHNYIEQYYTDLNDKLGSLRHTFTETPVCYPTLQDNDFLKIIFEDHIPHYNMLLDSEILIADNKLVKLDRSITGSDVDNGETPITIPGSDIEFQTINSIPIAYTDKPSTTLVEGQTALLYDNTGFTLGAGDIKYLYYSGTAPEKPIITFTLNPIIWKVPGETHHYIAYPLNSFSRLDWTLDTTNHPLPAADKIYNIFKIGNTEMRFSLPSIYLNFNEAKKIVFDLNGSNVNVVREALKENLYDPYARKWALACLVGWNEQVNADNFSTRMNHFIMQGNDPYTYYSTATFTFNSRTGVCSGKITIAVPKDTIHFTNNHPDSGTYSIIEVDENTGDMMQSGFLTINERCGFNSENHITSNECLPIITDYPPEDDCLKNITIDYRNMYL